LHIPAAGMLGVASAQKGENGQNGDFHSENRHRRRAMILNRLAIPI